MKMRSHFYLLLLPLLLLGSCKKFLDVVPNNTDVFPNTVTDFEDMLNNETFASPNYLLADLVSDDVALSDDVLKQGAKTYYVNGYFWAQKVWTAADNDFMYSDTYKSILQLNVILSKINEAPGGTAERKELVAAQAKINRAYYYLQLVNIYGADYQAATAETDLGVPLVLQPNASAKPIRSTVQEVYDQVLADLNEAVNTTSLPDFGADVIHPGKAAAFALLARTYLYMGDYENALAAAEAALKIKSTLMDYNNMSFTKNPTSAVTNIKNKLFTLKDQERNPEVLYAKICIDAAFVNRFSESVHIDKDLAKVLGTRDLRYVYNFYPKTSESSAEYFIYTDNTTEVMQFNYSLGVPEMMLIKAECLARKGEGAAAIGLLNTLRGYRFKKNEYKSLSTIGTDALALVVAERRRELFLHGGLRLFDLKRLNRDPKFKTDLKRVPLSGPIVTYATLEAGSPRYVIPFAPRVIANNPLIIQNER